MSFHEPLPQGGEGGAARLSRARIFEITFGSALAAGLTTALIEYALTLRHTHPVWAGDTHALLLLLVTLYGAVALVAGAAEGAAWNLVLLTDAVDVSRALLRRLRRDERFDREVSGALLAGGAAAVAFAFLVAELSFGLVAHSHRQLVASMLCGAIAAASLLVFAVLAFPLQRAMARAARALPRTRRVPGTAVLVLAAALAAPLGGAFFVESHLDWRELQLGPVIIGALFLGLQAMWALLFLWPLARVRGLVRVRRPLFAVALAAALVLPFAVLRGTPRPGAIMLLFQASYGGGYLVAVAQRRFDRDHDGFSTLLGGGDCDDHDPTVHPGAHDIPDDGIDQNCLGGDAHATPPPPPPAPVPGGFSFRGNVILLFIDTLRADKVTAERMPNLTAFAQRGAWFRRAYAQAPGTSRSFPSVITSRLPSRIAWDDGYQDYPGVLLENRNVFEALHQAGYHTVGVASHFYFKTPGLTQGFDEFDNSGAATPGEDWNAVTSPRLVERIGRMLPALAADPRPFAMLAHFADPHAAYEPHPEVRHGGPAPRTREGQYEEELTFLDDHLGRLFGLLRDQHLDENTMVVVFSDHGEAFGVHHEAGQDLLNHGQTLYDEVLRVPILVSGPGLAPRQVTQPVMLLDIAPTVLDALGVPIPPTFQGRSLAGALAGLPLAPAPVYAEMLPRPSWKYDARAILDADGHTKVIYRITQPRFELYDVESDPNELRDVSQLEPDVAARMRRQVASWLDAAP